MISVLVYGRNDERGYGMHKRVAISLNAMAHVLSAPTSEILFVDYNTPDHLPTLLELIRDDLTDAARVRTRVLRVRPSIHARFAELTPLPVLEPIARNIALRRSRAQNPWILSTNTDGIIAPQRGASLCDLAASLEGRHYGAPRFELPERVWETFDRRQPEQIIGAAEGWSDRARLREIVRGEGVVQFDSPGDFQLVRRADLFRIDGFNEDALLGWHIDYNLARRLELLNGAEGDLSQDVHLYHCGHARRATQTHNAERIENSLDELVHRVQDPCLPGQRDAWGCPDDVIEEVDLCAAPGTALLSALDAVMEPLPPASLCARYDRASFESLAYDAGHVAAHLTDLLSTFPRDARIAYSGCRRDMLDATVRGLAALGFERRIAIPDSLADRLGAAARPHLQPAPLHDILAHTDVFLFEFGLVRDEGSVERPAGEAVAWLPDEEAALDGVVRAYRACVDAERQAGGAGGGGRFVVAIGTVHSRFEPLIDSTLSATPSPFTTRLRYGTVSPDPAAVTSERPAATAASRPWSADVAAARTAFLQLLRGEDGERIRLETALSSARVRSMILSETFEPPEGVTREDLLARLDAASSPPADLVPILAEPDGTDEQTNGARSGSCLASLSDWDDPAWLEHARRIAHGGQRGAVPRNGWVWQRAQLLHALSGNLRNRSGRALVVSEHPDSFIALAGSLFAQVDLADIRDIFPGDDERLSSLARFSGGALLPESAYRIVALDGLAEASYDAIVLPHAAAFRSQLTGFAEAVASLRPLLAPGGLLAVAGEVSLLGAARSWRPALDLAGEGLAQVMSRHAGLGMIGAPERVISPRDAAQTGFGHDLDSGRPVLGVRRDGDVLWPAVWLFEGETAWRQPAGLAGGIARLSLGEQRACLSLTNRAHRDDGAIVGRPGEGDGHVFFGPFLRLPSGTYTARIEMVAARGGRFVAEVSSGPAILAQLDVVARHGQRETVVLPFRIGGGATLSEPCEVRLWSPGDSEVRIPSVRLEADRL